MPELIPSILSTNLEDYEKFAKLFSEFSHKIHIDVMDGIFVKNKSPNAKDILEKIKGISVKKNMHLMVANPKEVLDEISSFGDIEYCYIHSDIFDLDLLNYKFPFKLAVAFNPETEVKNFKELILALDAVLVMTVHPGRQGAEFTPESLEKIDEIKTFGFKGEIHIDGHVNWDTFEKIIMHEPEVLTLGSLVQGAENPKQAFEEIKYEIEKY